MAGKLSILDLGELSKPATVLIEKISNAIEGEFRPRQIRRIAQAEADAAIIHAQAEIEITDLHRRAVCRWVNEEAKKQENIESITAKAIPLLNDQSDPSKMEDDWVANFFDKSRLISDSEMQDLWAKVLAGEANQTGSYSKRTVSFLGSVDKHDAFLFRAICGYAWFIRGIHPLIYDVTKDEYLKGGVTFGTLTHLDAIGLIRFESVSGFRLLGFEKLATVYYYGQPIQIEFGNKEGNELDCGSVLLTEIGAQLAPICGSAPMPDFIDFVIGRWAKSGLITSSPWPRRAITK